MKILISKPKKEFIKELNREINVIKLKKYYVKDLTKDFSTSYGTISKKDLKKNGLVKSNTGKEFILLDANFIDEYKTIRRTSQIMTLKDIGYIISSTGVNKNSKVIDAGTGCGANAIFLAHLVKEVVSYEINKENIKVAKENIKKLNLKNIKIKEKSIFGGVDEKDVDLVVLDLPTPWNAINTCEKALKVGGYLVCYSPQITQTSDFVNAVKSNVNFLYEKTIELNERSWKIEGRVIRPRSEGIGHTGFLTFARKI